MEVDSFKVTSQGHHGMYPISGHSRWTQILHREDETDCGAGGGQLRTGPRAGAAGSLAELGQADLLASGRTSTPLLSRESEQITHSMRWGGRGLGRDLDLG